MKTLTLTTAILITSVASAFAETWTWAPIRDGATLNAYLTNFECIRPKQLPVFQMIEDINDKNLEVQKSSS